MSSRTSAIHVPILIISGSFMPRVVADAVPTRMPDVLNGLSVSNGIVFLLTMMPAASRAAAASLPVMPFEAFTSTRKRWLSVPPETMR